MLGVMVVEAIGVHEKIDDTTIVFVHREDALVPISIVSYREFFSDVLER